MSDTIAETADIVRVFTQPGDDFEAFTAATDWLEAMGFSVGSMERGEPIGVMFGSFGIAKWRNLSALDRRQLHGTITGSSKRSGPITVTIFASAPKEALDAVAMAEGR